MQYTNIPILHITHAGIMMDEATTVVALAKDLILHSREDMGMPKGVNFVRGCVAIHRGCNLELHEA